MYHLFVIYRNENCTIICVEMLCYEKDIFDKPSHNG